LLVVCAGVPTAACLTLLRLMPVTGAKRTWNPKPDTGGAEYPHVYAIAVAGGRVYVGGYFTRIGGAARRSLAALDPRTGRASSWNPSPGGNQPSVSALVLSGSVVYVAGDFTSIGGKGRVGVAAVDAASGRIGPWDPRTDGKVVALAAAAGAVALGGAFGSLGQREQDCRDAGSPGRSAQAAGARRRPRAFGNPGGNRARRQRMRAAGVQSVRVSALGGYSGGYGPVRPRADPRSLFLARRAAILAARSDV
jgi:hypothetical protein